MLGLSDSLRFMKTRGFKVARFYECKNKQELYSAFDMLEKPVVMKIDSKKHLHKSEVKGVVLNVTRKQNALKEFNRLMLLGESVVLQEQHKGIQLIFGIENDEVFGRLIMFGVGGIFVELLGDVSFRACPITMSDADEMINELKAKKVFEGFRGSEKINKNLIKKLLVKLCNFAEENNVKTLDLNPVFFKDNKYFVVDSRLDLIK